MTGFVKNFAPATVPASVTYNPITPIVIGADQGGTYMWDMSVYISSAVQQNVHCYATVNSNYLMHAAVYVPGPGFGTVTESMGVHFVSTVSPGNSVSAQCETPGGMQVLSGTLTGMKVLSIYP